MRKSLIGAFVFVFALGSWGARSLYLSTEAAPVFLNLASPDKTYRVELHEHIDTYRHWASIRSRFYSPRFNEVRFNAFKDGRLLVSNEFLWNDTSSDSRFFEHHEYRWVINFILRFGGDLSMPESKLDEVTVFNHTNHAVDELMIKSNDLFVILDLQPKTATTLVAHPHPGAWLTCEGQFASGKRIPFYGVNFLIGGNRDTHVPQHYCVAITDDRVLIQSREIEGDFDDNGAKVIVPKGDCGASVVNKSKH